MNKAFIAEYYENKYEADGASLEFNPREEDYAALTAKNVIMENKLKDSCSEETWEIYESIRQISFELGRIANQAYYLQGAYDRERMLQ